ncbi:Aldehyde dehydrogenase family 2 member [Arachis hypogaea]|nr:Aldehyde dehydrogenase family 2 member [Arachis hypogaea]
MSSEILRLLIQSGWNSRWRAQCSTRIWTHCWCHNILTHVDKVSFTGSTEVGGEIMHAAASSNLKQVSLELRGKSPLLIFQGEICVASSRVFVQEGIYNEFEKKLVEKAKAWVVGDPFDPKSQQGPQVDKKQFEKILSYIEHGKKEGATLLYGGKRLGDKGYYIEPTIFSDVKVNVISKKEY